MTFPKDFLWGGAVTAHQSEGAYNAGGKSPAVCDLFPKPEHSDLKTELIAIIVMMTIFHYLKKWASPVIVSQLTGQEYAQMVLTLVKKVCNSMMILLIQ